LPVEKLDDSMDVEPPALIRGYLRLGAKVLGAPAWDPDFNSADLPMMMRIADLPPRYLKHFKGKPARLFESYLVGPQKKADDKAMKPDISALEKSVKTVVTPLSSNQ
jgi:hypothetical protein